VITKLKIGLGLTVLLFLPNVHATISSLSQAPPGRPLRTIYLVANNQFLATMRGRLPAVFHAVSQEEFASKKKNMLEAVRRGSSLVWIGDGKLLPNELWIGTFRPAAERLSITLAKRDPLPLRSLVLNSSTVSSAYIKPTVALPYHNVVEEPRADLLPILEARDRFGQVVGYPGILMRYYAPSLAGHNFSGTECIAFFFDQPLQAMPASQWERLLNAIARHFSSGIQIVRVQTNFASYRSGEWVSIRATVRNGRPYAVATELHFFVKGPDEKEFRAIDTVRRCPIGRGRAEAAVEFRPDGPAGLWKIRVTAYEDIRLAAKLALRGNPVAVDSREIGMVVLDGPLKTPLMISVQGETLTIDGQKGFWAGTNYFPSSSWWDWLWRDFWPVRASEDFAAMRRTGYRIVRIWIDPVLDEQSLRAMDAAIYLAAQHGIVLDICIFTQWVRYIGLQKHDGTVKSFDFRHRDFNIYGISFRNLDLQRRYVALLARRWRGAGNVMYDLSNETAIDDPDPSQMDQQAQEWQGIHAAQGELRDTLLFRRWTDEITKAIRLAGGDQPIIPGYMFTALGQGDSYLGERHGQIESWHAYMSPEAAGASLAYVDPSCSARPLLLEEFGTVGWNHEPEYDGIAHFALGAGAAAAMSYEWGVSWLAPEMSFYPTPLREAINRPPDPRWFKPAISLAKSWSSRSAGIFPAPSGFQYGTIYSGTPFPAAAAIALGRLGLMGKDLSRTIQPESVYVLVPTAASGEKGAMSVVEAAIQDLWKEKVPFGVWQQDCLDHLPQTTRVLIVPVPVNADLSERLAQLSRKGIKVFRTNSEGWQSSPLLPRLAVAPSSAELLIRRTAQGTLYFLFSKEPSTFTLNTENRTKVSGGLSNYAMVHERNSVIDLIEASGEVEINGEPFCHIEQGRAIISATDSRSLVRSSCLRLMVTEPTAIRFERRIQRVEVLEAGRAEPLASFSPPSEIGRGLRIDDELARYVLEVEF
jgi:hypothetical protein